MKGTRGLLVLLVCAACGGAADSADTTVTIDTTIVHRGREVTMRIARNPARVPADAPVWRIAPEPEVSLGGDAMGDEPLFRVAGAIRLDDGRIVVADGGSTTLRVFDATGAQLTAIGGRGEGPGEFRGFSFLGRLPGDSIVVADFGLRRVTVFTPDGQVGREAQWGTGENSPRAAIVGLFADGSLVGRGFVAVETPPPHGLRRYPQTFFHLHPDGMLADTLGDFLGNETWFKPMERGFQVQPARFARATWFVAAGDRFHVAGTERYAIWVYSPAGQPLLLVERESTPVAVTPALLAAERQVRLDSAANEEARRERDMLLGEMPAPATLPAFDRLVVDDALHLWVRAYRPPGEAGPPVWAVFDPDGRLLTELEGPPGLEPAHIGRDFVLGLWRDANGVEHVRLYRLERT